MDKITFTEEELFLLSKEAEDRSKVYLFLSNFYLQRPDKNLLERIRAKDFVHAVRVLLSNEEFANAMRILEGFINSINDIPEREVIDSLAVDFTRLFRGIKKGYGPPPPYESVWRGEGRIMGEWTQKVLESYHKAGIGMDIGDELPDYIGIELKFMARLCYEESLRWKENAPSKAMRLLEMEKEFLDSHIMAWLPAFLSEAAEDSQTGLYRAILEISQGFIRADQRYLSSRV
ncbi:MAG: molecular chaperone [Thermodesulfovibrionales bacterium]